MTSEQTESGFEQWERATSYVNGSAVSTGDSVPVVCPADLGHQVGEVQLASEEVADLAVAAARAAFPGWRDMPSAERSALIEGAADRIAAALESLTTLLALEVGKVMPDARGDLQGALHLLRQFARLVPELEEHELLTGQEGTSGASLVRLRHVPVGPVAVIGPWNTPLFLTFNGVAPSLASGCTVVVKPPVEAPLALTAALRLLADALPPGVLNVVQGRGSRVGQALAAHPDIRAVMFTGGTSAGQKVLAAAAPTIKKVALELGGNDAAIVLEDAEITDQMITEMVIGTMSVTGQVCFNVKRIYVHRRRFDEFVNKYLEGLDRVIIGHPLDPTAHIGPLATADGFANARRLVEDARAAGARVYEAGLIAASADWGAGYFMRPTVVTGLAPDAELVIDEQFAPVIPVLPFDSEDEAIAEANRTQFGLASSVWSADLDHASTVAARLEAGNTYINTHRLGASVPRVPFGGVKQSGLGRTHGIYSLEHCTQLHAIIGFSDPAAQLPGADRWTSSTTPVSA